MTQDTEDVVARLESAVRALDWKAPVPDELQSDVRMVFNEALAGGPNMNGDGGPTLTPNHALDCLWATRRIQSLSDRIDVLEAENRQLQIDRVTTLAMFYSIAPGTIAKMCDEQLDKSGALLGMVRETAARAALHQEGIAPK